MSIWEWIKGWFTSHPKPVLVPNYAQPPIENISPVALPPPRNLPWLDLAIGNIGKREGIDDKWIVGLFSFTTYKTTTSQTPWCAAFVSAMCEMSGYKSCHSASAHDQINLGLPAIAQPGSVMIWRHKSGQLAGHYHTNFLMKKINDGLFKCVGGNQSNMVCIANYSLDDYELVAIRMPVKA
jgi:uncharacterized protein (TIGR02594 family)